MSGIPPHDEQFSSAEVARALRCSPVTEAVLQAITASNVFDLIEAHHWWDLGRVLIEQMRQQRMIAEAFRQACQGS